LSFTSAHADTFGSGGNAFTIDFVNIGNAGNADDAGAGGGLYSSPYGAVPYVYRIGTYEISQDVITKATASGLANVVAGAFTGSQPAANMTWFEAATFVNWLNTSTGHHAAYQYDDQVGLTLWSSAQAWQLGGENLYRHKDAYYFLPSEDEWYKAAYHKNDGVTANYWDYATGSNSIPTAVTGGTTSGTAVFGVAGSMPTAVNNAGGLSPYGTMAQNGNVREWQESAFDGTNDSAFEFNVVRGGYFSIPEGGLRSSTRTEDPPADASLLTGFRVASVPEPSTALLLIGSGSMLLLKRRRARSL
jgi:hypothetical protein